MKKKLIKKYKNLFPDFIINLYHNYLFFLDRKKKEKDYKQILYETQTHYNDVEKSIRNKGNSKINFASYVIFDSTFCGYGLMDLMLQNESKYSPKIVIIPDTSRGNINMIKQYKQTKDFFINKYGEKYVLDGYNLDNNEFIDLSDQFDIVYCANPYDNMVNKIHSINYLRTKNILPIYISYGYHVDKYCYNSILPLLEISLFWKVFADNKIAYNDYKKYELIHGKNVFLSGYAKMDQLEEFKKIQSSKKIIVIAPHHTVNMATLPLSNFKDNYDFILDLPKLYPEIKFIFRPHPLLFTTMINEGIWTSEQVNEYIDKLKLLNIDYSIGGDYLKIFAQSDAIIHDCASFVAEYLYTGKPCCFFAKKDYKKYFSKIGKKCLKYHYITKNREEICKFIEKNVLGENDYLAKKRDSFVKSNLAINYPNVSQIILDKITLV
ncbi:MAG: CDP-glycerol glycerophosphotransferase family protein [Treponema sp.]|nr:CDP-glycerol glycerophosphotransferase family protein [Treponema sp.]